MTGDLKLAFAQFEELETFARFGARLDDNTRKIIEHGRRIRACLKQPEFAPVSMTEQIAVLLALSEKLFDAVPLERMTAAEQAVREAAADIPTEVCARFESAKKLSEEDRTSIIQIAIHHKIGSAEELESVVRTMKAMAASSIGQYENAVRSLDDYYRTVQLGLAASFRENKSLGVMLAITQQKQTAIAAIVFGSDQGLVGQFNEVMVEYAVNTLKILPGKKIVWAVGVRIQSRLAETYLQPMAGFTLPNSINAITPLVGQILIEMEAQREQGLINQFYLFHNRPRTGSIYTPAS